jgi:hypothetical protein
MQYQGLPLRTLTTILTSICILTLVSSCSPHSSTVSDVHTWYATHWWCYTVTLPAASHILNTALHAFGCHHNSGMLHH